MTRALVTGATGYIGRQAVRALLDAGFEVHGVARRAGDEARVVWHQADVLDAGQRRALAHRVRATHLLHLAWSTEHGRFWSDPANVDWAAATLDLVRAFHDGGGGRVVAAGSCAEYDWDVPAARALPETASRRPRTLYGQAKLSTQELLTSYGAAVGLSEAWAVLFFSYGPFEHPERLVPSIVNDLLAGQRVTLRAPSLVRDFMDVVETGRALAALLASDVTGRVNVASGVGMSIADLAGRLAAVVRRPDLVVQSAAPTNGTEPPVLVADVGRLRAEVGFVPERDLDASLERAVEYWRTQREPKRSTA